ncbi:MAG TPA: tail fiber domain-containing protein [Dehalococcoidia bacterium]|nr:tail fiber domain-containing protein [Dehalococcoidia bacterium]
MLKGRNRPYHRLVVFMALSAVLTLLLSGCMWGLVTDPDTGAPLAGTTVSYTDSNGGTGSTTTDANGMYSFDQAHGPYPAPGPVSFEISRPGYDMLTVPRLAEYNDNANASLADLSSFWDVQHFELIPHMVQRVVIEITGVDVDHAALSPPVMVNQRYVVGYMVFDPADATTPVCQDHSDWIDFVLANPVPVPLDFECTVVGDDFWIVIAVGVNLEWQTPAPHVSNYLSTSSYDWLAPDTETSWQHATLDSSDATGPDSPNIAFEAQIRFKSALGPEASMISDRNLKDNFAAVSGRQVLAKLAGIPILTWNYKADDPAVRHMGPMAQDFYAAFGLADTDKAIFSVDAYGVAFAAIQELYGMMLEKDSQIAALQQQVADLSARLAALEKRLGPP